MDSGVPWQMKTWDVIVVGAGPAGCAAAYDLAAAGAQVLLLDKAQFPRPKLCAGGVTIKALNRLRYSIAPVVQETSRSIGVGLGYSRRVAFSTNAPVCALVVRAEFDAFCFEKTLAKGAQFLQIGGIQAVKEGADDVLVTLSNGSTHHTRYLLAADGAHSPLRKLLGADKPHMAVGLEALVPRQLCKKDEIFRFDFGVIGQGYAWVFPKRDHFNVGLYTRDADRFPLEKSALREYTRFSLGTETLEDLRGFPIATGAGLRVPNAERCFLIGDAGGYAEQLLGEGIHNAIASGQNAASALLASKGAPASHAFFEAQGSLIRDARRCTLAANVFYGMLPVSHFLLQAPPLREALMQGFAGGRTLSQCVKALLKFQPGCPPCQTNTPLL
ncbi:Hypothetical protein HDN1F_24420 [gamma proteobacterium HdN1]|nr:Hypothetical protein HDN1F_24420 [gamma proteobacterium HdN1]